MSYKLFKPAEVKSNRLLFSGPRGAKAVGFNFISRPKSVFGYKGEGLSSLDPRFVDFKFELAQKLTEEYPYEIKDGFSNSPITSNFFAMLSAPGVLATPYNAPNPLDPGVQRAPTPEEIKIFESILRCMFKDCEPTSVKIAKLSSTSMPNFVSDLDYKKTLFMSTMNNLGTILKEAASGSLETLAKQHIVLSYVLRMRAQPDGGKFVDGRFEHKKRWVNNPDFLSSVKSKMSDKVSVDYDSEVRKYNPNAEGKAFGMRLRTVYAMSSGSNYVINAFVSQFRTSYLKRYKFSFKTRTLKELGDKLKRADHIVGIDFVQMDQNYQPFHVKLMENIFSERINPEFGKFHTLAMTAPYYATSFGEVNNVMVGHPLDRSTFGLNLGLPSGIGTVSDIGKAWALGVGLIAANRGLKLIDVSASTDDQIDSFVDLFLKGEHPRLSTVNAGDDGIYMCTGPNSEEDAALLSAEFNSEENIVPIAVEDGVAFTGGIVWKKNGIIADPVPNPVTFLTNRLSPEHDWLSQHRKYAGYGYLAAREHYMRSGYIIRDIEYIMDTIWRKHINWPTPLQLAKIDASKRSPDIDLNDLDDISLEVMVDPNKLNYKYELDEVDPKVLDLSTSSVHHDLFIDKLIPFINSWSYNG